MRILHYLLGFPPYRTGGLTKYATDLMTEQVKDGHNVMGLWPGQMRLLNHKTIIKKKKAFAGIESYELINPLPVSLDEGIQAVDDYMKPCESDVYMTFMVNAKPDVIHVHTLMGIHKEFFDVAYTLGKRIIFTAHDYFGICPKVTLYRYGKVCNDLNCENCFQCNRTALSLKKIYIMQSPLYRQLKNSSIIKLLRKNHREDFFSDKEFLKMPVGDIVNETEQYNRLRGFYLGILENVDVVHFNSSVTEAIYKRYFVPQKSEIITITHKNIADNKKTNSWQAGDVLRITSLAPARPYKGFYVLKNALDELWDSGKHDFKLNLYSPVRNSSEYMTIKEDGFTYDELGKIFAVTDILVAPSICYETFGFTVLEALSYGVPVIVSNNVGAKDIVGSGGIIVEAGNVKQLKHAVIALNYETLSAMRENIRLEVPIKSWRTLVEETYHLYKKCKD